MILKVGLTGGIASGKSTVRRHLADLGCVTVDADRLVAELYQPGRPGHRALAEAYGSGILLPDGEVDRRRLSSIAFSSPAEAARLNALIHPIVMAEEARLMGEAERENEGRSLIYVVEATLLLEAGGRRRYDRIIVVDLSIELQIERAAARGMEREEAARRIAHQMPREERLGEADYVIDNRGSEEALLEETRRVHQRLVRDLAQKEEASR